MMCDLHTRIKDALECAIAVNFPVLCDMCRDHETLASTSRAPVYPAFHFVASLENRHGAGDLLRALLWLLHKSGQHILEFLLSQCLYAQLVRFGQLAASLFTDDQIISFLLTALDGCAPRESSFS